MRARPVVVLALVSGLVLGGCTSEEEPVIETAEIRSGEVVQTVAAPAQLQAAAREQVSAPLGGEVETLLVGDGDVVEAGDPLVRLSSDSLASQVEQAEAAVNSAEELGASTAGAGLDLAPVLGAFRGQLDTLLPELLAALGGQLDTTEAVLDVAAAGMEQTTRTADELSRSVQDALADAQQALDELEVPEVPDGVEVTVPELDPGAVPELTDDGPVADALGEARQAAAGARSQLTSTERALADASQQLRVAEQDLAAQAERTEQAQAAAVAAQVDQAEFALEAARARINDLEVLAPISGVVELARGGDTGTGGIPALPEGLSAEGLGDLAGELGGDAAGGFEEALGGDPGTSTDTGTGPVLDGDEVAAGQPLLTVYDLSSFTARVEVDEIDVVEVAEGQPVVIRVDAFPGVELGGVVDHIALAPSRDVIGGALYPVTVRLTEVPDDVALRVGLTASAEIEVRRLTGDTVVPTSALLRRGDGEVVHVVRDGVAVEVPVELLAIGDEDAAVRGDIEPGEAVVTTGVELVADGDEIPT